MRKDTKLKINLIGFQQIVLKKRILVDLDHILKVMQLIVLGQQIAEIQLH